MSFSCFANIKLDTIYHLKLAQSGTRMILPYVWVNAHCGLGFICFWHDGSTSILYIWTFISAQWITVQWIEGQLQSCRRKIQLIQPIGTTQNSDRMNHSWSCLKMLIYCTFSSYYSVKMLGCFLMHFVGALLCMKWEVHSPLRAHIFCAWNEMLTLQCN